MYKILNDYLIHEIDNKLLKKKYDVKSNEFNFSMIAYLWEIYILENP